MGGERKGQWLGHRELTGRQGGGRGQVPRSTGREAAGPQSRVCLEELNKYLLSVPSMEGRELFGLRAFISGALAFSLVGASGTKQVTTNMSRQLPREGSRRGIAINIPPQPRQVLPVPAPL